MGIDIVGPIRDMLKKKQPVSLAIGGYGGSGKTTLAKSIQKEFQQCQIVPLDDFALAEGGSDRTRIISEVLQPLAKGKTVRYQRFDWSSQSLTEWVTVPADGLVIVEGISALGEDFNSYYDLRVWIDCSLELAAMRGMERDRKIHPPEYMQMWEERWMKEDREYSLMEPWRWADVIIPS